MPPRKAAGTPAKRATRASARKSAAKPSSKIPTAKDPPESSLTKRLEITVSTSSPITPKSSDKPSHEVPSETLPSTTPEITSLTSQETVSETSSIIVTENAPKIDAKITEPAAIVGTLSEMAAQPPDTTAAEAAAPETVESTTKESGVESAAVAEAAVPVLPAPETVSVVESVPENFEKGNQETTDEGTGRSGKDNVAAPKAVVKKTIKVVKKVIKKKLVTKRVAKCANKESEKLEIAGDGERNSNFSATDSMEVEKANPNVLVAMEVEKNPNPSVTDSMEIENPNPGVTISLGDEHPNKSEVCEVEKEVTLTDVASELPISNSVGDKKKRVVKKVVKKKLVPKRVAKCSNKESEKVEIACDGERNSNLSVSNSTEVEKANPNVLVAMEVEKNPIPSATDSMEIENPNPSVTISLGVEHPNKSEFCEVEKEVILTEIASELPVSSSVGDQKKGDEVEKLDLDNGVLMEVMNGDSVEDGNGDSVEDGNGENVTENVDLGGVGDVGVKEEVENCVVSGSKGEVEVDNELVVLSEEMEALERRRRRKTEIFIGGLDKSVKEEDIRKVFEEVGEIVEVRLMMNSHTGKNKGYAFLRYASAVDAKKALEKHPKVEICGKQCGTAPVEGNDTIFLGNIDKKWKSEDVAKLLQEIGIEKIDKVTVMADPSNIVYNRGFAFLELETNKDAQNAYKKLQKKDAFGKHHSIKVAWAEPLNEPDEEEMLKVKSVYAEFIPPSWDEEKVRDYFKKFGEIDNIVLARNLRSSKRKDFAFVNYTTREAALACIESSSHELSNDEGSKVNVKVSLAKPIPKGKQNKRVSNPISKESFKEKPKAAQRAAKPNDSRNKGKSTRINFEGRKGDRISSTTARLAQLSREQASWRQSQTGLGIGSVNVEYPYTLPARKRPYSALEGDPRYSDLRGYPRTRFESSYPVASPSYSTLPQGVGVTSLPYYQRQGAGYTSGSIYGNNDHSSSIQRERASYRGSDGLYYRY